jgi:hypothetical protein
MNTSPQSLSIREDIMSEAMRKPISSREFIPYSEIASSLEQPKSRRGGESPLVQYTSPRTPIIGIKADRSLSSVHEIEAASHSRLRNIPEKIDAARDRGAKSLSLAITGFAFVSWLILMLTVAAQNGSAFQIVMITMIPFAAHIVSMYLAASGTPLKFDGKHEL